MPQKKSLGKTQSGGIWHIMRVLYIGHYKEGSGWSNAAISHILALDSCGVDVVCRDIKLTNQQFDIPNRILELEKKPLENIDYCIQMVLPHHLVGTEKFKKNIAFFFGETTEIKDNVWVSQLNLMDEVWVANDTNKNSLEKSNVEKPIKVVPLASDTDKFEKDYDILPIPEIGHTFKFYFIGDLNDRKNITSVIKCFHSEFCNGEQVSLIIKINEYGMNPEALKNKFQQKSSDIKKNMRIGSPEDYATEVIISSHMTDDQINMLHKSCDCFVNLSHGEAWSIPAFDAMAFGNTPICSNEGGPKSFIGNKETGWLVDGMYNICDHSNPALPFLFTAKEEWFVPSESEAKKAMRYYYENRNKEQYAKAGLLRAKDFNYTNVVNIIKEHLSE